MEEPMSHHYLDCGLDNVWLEDGYDVHRTPYGKGISIRDTAALHHAIGRWMIAHPKPLDGADLRFIRTELELTQRGLADMLGATEQTLRLWEKYRKKPLPGPADRLLRALYGETLNGEHSVRDMTEKLAISTQDEDVKGIFRRTRTGWQVARANALA
jgi:DNA-binding transcriptional regulator YiaG